MTLTAGAVITAARDRHASFGEAAVPRAVALRQLSQYVRMLHGRVAILDPAILFAADLVVPLPLADHDAGIDISTVRYIAEVRALTADGSEAVIDYVPSAVRDDRNQPALVVWVEGTALHLQSPASRWAGYSSLHIKHLPIPAALSSEADPLPLPDTSEMACAAALALAFGRRASGLDAQTLQLLVTEAAEAETAFLDDIGNRATAEHFTVRDVWP